MLSLTYTLLDFVTDAQCTKHGENLHSLFTV